MNQLSLVSLLLATLLLTGCGADQAELERRVGVIGDVCQYLDEARLRRLLPIPESSETEIHRPPTASQDNHLGCVATWDQPASGAVLGMDIYLYSGRGPEPGEKISRLLERGEYRAGQHFPFQPVEGLGDAAAYNEQLNMIAWSLRGHLFYLNATDLPGMDRSSLAELARAINREWPV